MTLDNLSTIFKDHGCNTIYVKKLSANDNSKNQVYLAGSFDILNIFPISSIKSDSSGDWVRDRFKANLNFSWISNDYSINPAPYAQLILYPKYPEVRFSGFLKGCKNSPSELMTLRLEGRLLFLSVTSEGNVLGYVTSHSSNVTKEFSKLLITKTYGLFKIYEIGTAVNNKQKLLDELNRIHKLGWIQSKRLDKNGNILSCTASNCGGYTLEAELGVTPNSYSKPDYLGWEIKQFNVRKFDRLNSSIITLMTPEPNGGYYKEKGVESFIRKYGYKDTKGRERRMNFGGVHNYEKIHNRTNLKLTLIGYDSETGKIRNTDGKIALLDNNENIIASWDFASLITHWNRKHNQACYVPSISKNNSAKNYYYGNNIILGMGTDFTLFLKQLFSGNIYYDPGIKLEIVSNKPKIKRRSQFRIKSRFITNLYNVSELVNLIE